MPKRSLFLVFAMLSACSPHTYDLRVCPERSRAALDPADWSGVDLAAAIQVFEGEHPILIRTPTGERAGAVRLALGEVAWFEVTYGPAGACDDPTRAQVERRAEAEVSVEVRLDDGSLDHAFPGRVIQPEAADAPGELALSTVVDDPAVWGAFGFTGQGPADLTVRRDQDGDHGALELRVVSANADTSETVLSW